MAYSELTTFAATRTDESSALLWWVVCTRVTRCAFDFSVTGCKLHTTACVCFLHFQAPAVRTQCSRQVQQQSVAPARACGASPVPVERGYLARRRPLQRSSLLCALLRCSAVLVACGRFRPCSLDTKWLQGGNSRRRGDHLLAGFFFRGFNERVLSHSRGAVLIRL